MLLMKKLCGLCYKNREAYLCDDALLCDDAHVVFCGFCWRLRHDVLRFLQAWSVVAF